MGLSSEIWLLDLLVRAAVSSISNAEIVFSSDL